MTTERTPDFWAGYTRGVHMAAAAAGKAGTGAVATMDDGGAVERAMAVLRASQAGIAILIATVPPGVAGSAFGAGYRHGVETASADAVEALNALPARLMRGDHTDEEHAATAALIEQQRQAIMQALLEFSTQQTAPILGITPR